MVTMKMVAKHAGVSTATVSRVLNNPLSCSEYTTQKVMDAIGDLGYQPNSIARSLRQKKSSSFLAMVNDIQNPVFAEMIRGMEDAAYKENFSLIIGNTDNSIAKEENYLDVLLSRKVDGVILITPRVSVERIRNLSKTMLVVIVNDTRLNLHDLPLVYIDDHTALYELMGQISAESYKKLYYITGNLNTGTGQQRKKAFVDYCTDNNLNFKVVENEGSSYLHGRESMKKLIATEDLQGSCVVGYNDNVTIGAMKVAEDNGFSPGKNIFFAGFDGIPSSGIVSPPLTTVQSPTYEIGAASAKLLIGLINKEVNLKKQIKLSHKIILRQSTKATN